MSSFSVETSVLKSLVITASKGASNNKMSTITNLANVVVANGQITITTTDGTNYFSVKGNVLTSDSCEFVVGVDVFTKLVAKTSANNISITATEDMISFTGNGTYKIPIQLDVDGSPIRYPRNDITSPETSGTIKTSTIKSIIFKNKSSLSTVMDIPCLTGYLCLPDCVISGDRFNICRNTVETFGGKYLVNPITFELLSLSKSENIEYRILGNAVVFESDDIKLYSRFMDGVDTYPVESVTAVIEDSEFKSECVLPKTAVLNVVDRLSLFIKDNDTNGVYMTFTKDGVKIESINGNGIESIPYQGSTNFSDFTCCVGVDSIKRQFSSRAGESVNIMYGNDDALMIKDEDTIHVLGLLDDPRLDGE